jgi:hypothetical protein
MGVLTCVRDGCNNIMCDTYVLAVGYICNDCKEEFKSYLYKNSIQVNSDDQIERALKEFMNTYKENETHIDHNVVDDFFRRNTNL